MELKADRIRRRVLGATGALTLAGTTWLTACSRQTDPQSGTAPSQSAPSTTRPKVVALLWEGEPVTRPSPEVAEEQKRMGWIEGKTHVFHRRGYKSAEDLAAVVNEIIALRPDVIVTYTTPATRAVMQATTTIPVLFNVGDDPVESGLVPSLSRPGGNVTGYYWGVNDEKRLELVKRLVPPARRVAFMRTPGARLEESAAHLGLQLRRVQVAGEQDLDLLATQLRSLHCDAIVVSQIEWMQRENVFKRVANDFIDMRLPSVGPGPLWVRSGGLAAYAPTASVARAVQKLDGILRGANPADIPVEMPTGYRLLINERTAHAIGLAIPKHELQIADAIVR